MHQDRTGADTARVPGGGQIEFGFLSRGNGDDAVESSPIDLGAQRRERWVSIFSILRFSSCLGLGFHATARSGLRAIGGGCAAALYTDVAAGDPVEVLGDGTLRANPPRP